MLQKFARNLASHQRGGKIEADKTKVKKFKFSGEKSANEERAIASNCEQVCPKDPPRTKNTTDSKFTIRRKFATAIVKHYSGHFETTIFKRKFSCKSLRIVKKLWR